MKRSTIIAIIIIFVSIVAGGVLGFYFYLNSSSTARNQFGPQGVNTGTVGSPGVNTSVVFPGNASSTQPTQTPEITATSSTSTLAAIPALRHIYTEPTAGMHFFMRDIFATTTPLTETIVVANGTTTATTTRTVKPTTPKLIGKMEIMEFMDRGTGHIYETASNTLAITKTSITTHPKTYEALFVGPGSVIMRGLHGDSDTIKTQFGNLRLTTPTSSEKTLVVQDLGDGMQQVVLSPNKARMFYLQNKKPIGVISNLDGTGVANTFDSPFREWIASWPNDKTITITTKASSFAKGYMYTINTGTQALQKVIGDKNGLTTLMSPDGNKVIYSESKGGTPNLYVLDVRTGIVINLFFRTLSEKCVWSNQETDVAFCAVPQDVAFGDYPDAWYQGLIFFSDDIWKINTRTGETRLLAKLSKLSDQAIDVVNPVLNPTETLLMFNNKIDLSLWGLRTVNDSTATSTATTTPAR